MTRLATAASRGGVDSASGGRRGSLAVQQAVQVVKVLQHDEDMDDSDKKWYQKVSWVCIGFVMLLAVLCGYAYVDVNTVKTTKADNVTVEETLSEENGVYVNLVVGVILVFTQYCLLAMCFLSFVGWLFGRKRWWAGPYCTGFIGFGDGSAAEVPPERLLKSWGISTVSEDLYFDAKKWTPKEPPVRLARELVLMGYRGRSDDPMVRPGMAAWSMWPFGKCPRYLRAAPGGSGQLDTPRERPRHRAPSPRLGCSSQPPPKLPMSPPLTIQARSCIRRGAARTARVRTLTLTLTLTPTLTPNPTLTLTLTTLTTLASALPRTPTPNQVRRAA